ncbi:MULTISPECIES: DUF2934 domain-containing protein [unclassified Mesorhizobium]|uniref:DUF2934 domain-containing protein n=1 Tax=unclassified Mesorhizobium TaxID=325217 RepID=UPI000F7658AC|nr:MULTISPECIES: DUF2934 domain-containing protein [unclassified Mesorhizobium]AZO24457.1 DUF2934 domain-containing protein [Mesorhizobium sp. M1E.F.Ca.ET.045.02.1.1]RUW31954.1 DUF2934 domain-containing protein [Mesorhizobium sp. M1E.F.Ca.ET.041.01.1.1]RUW83632.1 DUF2934 domain-containing protein [Mesorhizobium sp. M1E.F.Ca.ET.063.01.1.1]RWB51013.1 MAG: DUF2934 domain-containing protein [Mesorhizobium sp.]RWD79498.1 MAG: DUF2934 domain-containing protein [Mesorhizobium sp.]
MAEQTREERIRQRAYELWEKEGKPEGADLRFWEQAMSEIDDEDQRKGSPDKRRRAS